MGDSRLSISPLGGDRWRVAVRAGTPSEHIVTIPEGYAESLGLADVAPERLLEESFRFLLEREPNTSILRAFGLPVIASYFPAYEKEMTKRLR